MSPAKEFLQYAAECRDVAALTNDVARRATWNEMADRLLRCAELVATESQADEQARAVGRSS
jgi:hypothetical protein